MEYDKVKKAIEGFAKNVIVEAKQNLQKGGQYGPKIASGNLYKSLKEVVNVGPNSIQVNFNMAEYGYYQDRGVKGRFSTYPEINKYGTKAQFGSGKGKKGGLTEAINNWVASKRFQFRDKETGRFMSYKSTAYLIIRSIYNKGLKPSLFFTKPFEKYFNRLPETLTDSFALDMENFIEFTTKQNIKDVN